MQRLKTLFILLAISSPAVAASTAEPEQSVDYLNVKIDRIVIDSDELARASETLADSIDGLASAITSLSSADSDMSETDRQTLLTAVESAQTASIALTEMAQQLPLRGQQLGERLPEIVSETRASMAELAVGLQSARDSILLVAESLPQATENSKQLVNSVLDSALIRLSIFGLVLIAVVALALIGIMWFVYRQYIAPLVRKLDALSLAPEHFDNMARHMKDTSSNLLLAQDSAGMLRGPALRRRERQSRRS